MAKRDIVLMGQTFGRIAWVSHEGGEAGLYVEHSTVVEVTESLRRHTQTKVVLHGSGISRALDKGTLTVGTVITAQGRLTGRTRRVTTQAGDSELTVEALLEAKDLQLEGTCPNQPPGMLYATLKGVVMYWHPDTLQLKSFLDKKHAQNVVCSLFMPAWTRHMRTTGKTAFFQAMKVGREFTAAGLVTTDHYQDRNGVLVPVMQILPKDFRLQR